MINKKILPILLLTSGLAMSGCSQSSTSQNSNSSDPFSKSIETEKKVQDKINNATQQENEKINNSLNENDMNYVETYNGAILHTNYGDIKIKFYNEDSPITVNNFLKLADEKFYDGTTFHRVIKDFMIQGGDPNSKDDDWSNDGMGGPGYAFQDEFNKHLLVKGSVAMANAGPNTNGSQFFIVTAESTPWLDGKHTNFGEVTEGIDVVNKIALVKVNENDHPLENVTVKSIELIKK